jgi:UDP-N-acetylglucosamine acyltransferase
MTQVLANIHPGAQLHPSVQVEAFATIQDDVIIGEGTWIGPNAVIMSGSRIGKNCKIFPGAVIGGIPQDLKFAGEYTTVEIGDNTTIRECVTVNRGTVDRLKTVVGNNVLLMAYVHIAHDCIVGNNCILANNATLGGHVIVEDYAILGGGVMVHQFSLVGKHVMVSGGGIVIQDVPPYVTTGRYPVAYGGVNKIGLGRRNFSPESIALIEEMYRIIFMSKRNTSQAIQYIEENIQDCPEKQEILGFIRKSTRGIIKKKPKA